MGELRLSSDILEGFKSAIALAEEELKQLAQMIEILQKTGEDTTHLRAKFANTQAKLDRYKRAME